MPAITEGRLRHQAKCCEHAKHKRCKCRCGGLLHGQPHAEEWIAREMYRERLREQWVPGQLDWVGFPEQEDVYL